MFSKAKSIRTSPREASPATRASAPVVVAFERMVRSADFSLSVTKELPKVLVEYVTRSGSLGQHTENRSF